jgi:type IV secretion system protein VirD4
MSHREAFLILFLILATASAWFVCPALPGGRRHTLPRHRARWMRIKLHLRMKPGLGFATALELWLRWGRWASFRESGRSRQSLSIAARLRSATHSVFLGRAHRGHGIRVAVQEHLALIGPPRSGKSGLLSALIMRHDGAVVSTSSKPDMFGLTSGLRSRRGPVYVFNPQGIGNVAGNVRWNPIEGCDDPSVAIRRAAAFAGAVSTGNAENGDFFAGQAASHLRAMFSAGAIAESDMRLVAHWILDTGVSDPVGILTEFGFEEWGRSLAKLDSPASKTDATIRMIMREAVGYTVDPRLSAATTPGVAGNFDVDEFLLSGGTLYMVARSEKDSPLAPLFAALAAEIQHRATMLGSQMPGGRLDPPLFMALDEVTQICPVPLPQWLADSGGQGVQIASAFHGTAQLIERWGLSGGQTVLDTSGVKVIYPGITEYKTLEGFAALCGTHAHQERSNRDSKGERHENVVTPEMIRRLPPGFGLLIRGGNAPVIAKLARGWKVREYRRAKRHGRAVAAVAPASAARALRSAQPRAQVEPEPVARLRAPEELEPFGAVEAEFADVLAPEAAVPNPWAVRR